MSAGVACFLCSTSLSHRYPKFCSPILSIINDLLCICQNTASQGIQHECFLFYFQARIFRVRLELFIMNRKDKLDVFFLFNDIW